METFSVPCSRTHNINPRLEKAYKADAKTMKRSRKQIKEPQLVRDYVKDNIINEYHKMKDEQRGV